MNILSAILLERLHRFVFDVYYQQDYTIKKTDRIILWFYHLWCKIHKQWRQDLLRYFGKCDRYLRYYYALSDFVNTNLK